MVGFPVAKIDDGRFLQEDLLGKKVDNQERNRMHMASVSVKGKGRPYLLQIRPPRSKKSLEQILSNYFLDVVIYFD